MFKKILHNFKFKNISRTNFDNTRHFNNFIKRLFTNNDNITSIQIKNKISSEIVYKSDNLHAEPAQIYYDLLEKHYKMRIPFIDENYYKDLLKISSDIEHNSELEAWDILDRYAILNIETIDEEFLTEILKQLAKIKYSKYEIWYYSEKQIIKNLINFKNNQIASLILSFGFNDKGSNFLFSNFSKIVLDRKIRSFTREEFEMIYLGFKCNKIKDKLLWAFLERARVELYPN